MRYSIVSGGSSGLGLELAKQIAQRGSNVIITGRNQEKLEKACNDIKEINDEISVIGYSFDISNEEQVDKFFENVKSKNIVVDYLYNNAGKGFFGNVEDITSEDINAVFNSNLIGLILMTSRFIQTVKNKNYYARIVNILSTAALVGKKNETIYNSAKWGARGFAESVRDEVKGSNIEVVICCPGGMNTNFWNEIDSGYDFSSFMNPSDVAEEIVELTRNEKMIVSDIVINRRKKF